jgi:hypothetical protein
MEVKGREKTYQDDGKVPSWFAEHLVCRLHTIEARLDSDGDAFQQLKHDHLVDPVVLDQ